MFTIFGAIVESIGDIFFWALFGIPVLWALYMMTFRTDDWLRLRREEQERKAQRQERIGKVFKGAFDVAKWWLNK
jgi:hypothetical protein